MGRRLVATTPRSADPNTISPAGSGTSVPPVKPEPLGADRLMMLVLCVMNIEPSGATATKSPRDPFVAISVRIPLPRLYSHKLPYSCSVTISSISMFAY